MEDCNAENRSIINTCIAVRNNYWALDVLCQMGFCFCDPDDEFERCYNPKEPEVEITLANDARIPQRFRGKDPRKKIYRKRVQVSSDKVALIWKRVNDGLTHPKNIIKQISSLVSTCESPPIPEQKYMSRSHSINFYDRIVHSKYHKRCFSFSLGDPNNPDFYDSYSQIDAIWKTNTVTKKSIDTEKEKVLEKNEPAKNLSKDASVSKTNIVLPCNINFSSSHLNLPANSPNLVSYANSNRVENQNNKMYCLPGAGSTTTGSSMSLRSSSHSEFLDQTRPSSRNEYVLPLEVSSALKKNLSYPRISITFDDEDAKKRSDTISSQIYSKTFSPQPTKSDNYFLFEGRPPLSSLSDREVLYYLCSRMDTLAKQIDEIHSHLKIRDQKDTSKHYLAPISVVYSNRSSPVEIYSPNYGFSSISERNSNRKLSSSTNNLNPNLIHINKKLLSAASSNDRLSIIKDFSPRTTSADALSGGKSFIHLKYPQQAKSPSLP